MQEQMKLFYATERSYKLRETCIRPCGGSVNGLIRFATRPGEKETLPLSPGTIASYKLVVLLTGFPLLY